MTAMHIWLLCIGTTFVMMYVLMQTTVKTMHTKQTIRALLDTNDAAVARALVALNERQNVEEQQQKNTKYLNGRGFRPCHARMGTSMAEWYKKTGFLTPRQIAYWRRRDKTGTSRIGVYAAQLLIVAAEKKAASA